MFVFNEIIYIFTLELSSEVRFGKARPQAVFPVMPSVWAPGWSKAVCCAPHGLCSVNRQGCRLCSVTGRNH